MAAEPVTSGLEQWDEEYRNDPVWEALDRIITELQQVEPDEDEQYEYDRLLLTLQFIYGYRDTPNILVSQQMMTNLSGAVTGNLSTHVTNWIDTSAQDHLNKAISQLNTILEYMRGWPVSKEKSLYSAARTVKAATQRFESRASELAEAIESSKGELKTYVDDQEVRFDQREDERLERFNQLEAKLTQLDQVVSQYTTKADEINKRVDSVMTTQQNNFSTAETQRQKDNSDNIAKQQTLFEEELDKAIAASEAKLEVQANTGQEIIDHIKELETQAKNLVEATAGASTSTDYGKYAEAEKKTADRLRITAVLVIILGGVAVVSLLIYEGFDGGTGQTWLIKSALSLPFVAAAWYLVSESSRHRDEAELAKDTQLRILGFPPFIVNMDDDDQKVLRKAAATELFVTDRRLNRRNSKKED